MNQNRPEVLTAAEELAVLRRVCFRVLVILSVAMLVGLAVYLGTGKGN